MKRLLESRFVWSLGSAHYLKENHCPWDESTCEKAAKGGHLDVLEYLHENDCPWDEWTCWHAARGGHLERAEIRTREGLSMD